jgi:N-terminal half of MaoC dehydratase
MSNKQNMSSVQKQYELYKQKLGTIYTAENYGAILGGPEYPKPFVGFNRQASIDTIMHFVDGIGDLNPIFRDEEYAKKTKYGCLIAPPCFLYSVWWAGTGLEMPTEMHGWYGGSEWEWFRPICEGDRFDWKTIQPFDVQLKHGRMAGEQLIVYNQDYFIRQGGEVIAKHKGWAVHAGKDDSRKKDKYTALSKIHEYSTEEINKIHEAQANEVIRGADPRHWEDVEVGEELIPIVQGPRNMNDPLLWLIGSGNLWNKSDRLNRIIREQHPNIAGIYDPILKIWLNVELPHLDDRMAKNVGLPAAYDFGCERISFIGMLLTNWMGDDGFLWKLRAELRGFNLVGDTTWCKGKVVQKYMDGKKCCVDIECWGENQRGEITVPGSATVILPSREYGSVTYPTYEE